MTTKEILTEYIINNQNKFYRIAYSYIKNREGALDAVQTAIYKSLKNSERLKNPEAIRAWFYRILINTSIDLIKGNDWVSYDENIEILGKSSDTTENSAEFLDLHKALEVLDEKEKTIIVLRFFEDLKLSEIEKITGWKLSSIKSTLYRALPKLKVKIQESEIKEIENE